MNIDNKDNKNKKYIGINPDKKNSGPSENDQYDNKCTDIDIKEETDYCLNCKIKPCAIKGCPLNNNIPGFIEAIKQEQYEEAFEIVSETTVLPAICGRICPHYKQCMGSCIRGIKGEPVKIGELEAFIGDLAIKNRYKIKKIHSGCEKIIAENTMSNDEKKNVENTINDEKKNVENTMNDEKKNFENTMGDEKEKNFENTMGDEKEKDFESKRKIAIVGGGPAGLTAAAFLARKGNQVTIYEKYNYLGGLLVHGIPEFRLPKEIVKNTVDKILDLGIDVKYNQEFGNNLKFEELEREYDYIILAFGANTSSKARIDGENLQGVYGANELLEYNNHPNYEGKTVIVNGGGNVAMDAARTIKKLGAKKVIVAYRRAKEQMPAEAKEVEDAIEEGIEFLFLNKIIKILGKDKVEKIELIRTELVKKEGQDRLFPVDVEGSNYEIEADYVVMAIGSHPADFVKKLGIDLDEKGYIKVDENGRTSNQKIYAIGDLAGNIATVAWAARSGREINFE